MFYFNFRVDDHFHHYHHNTDIIPRDAPGIFQRGKGVRKSIAQSGADPENFGGGDEILKWNEC